MIKSSIRSVALALGIFPLIAACVGGVSPYPVDRICSAQAVSPALSALERPVAADSALTGPSPLDPAMGEEVARWLDAASAAHRAFAARLPAARRQIEAGGQLSAQSNGWALAQLAYGQLDSLRAQSGVALAQLDLLLADALLAHVDVAPILDARERVAALLAQEDSALAELKVELGAG